MASDVKIFGRHCSTPSERGGYDNPLLEQNEVTLEMIIIQYDYCHFVINSPKLVGLYKSGLTLVVKDLGSEGVDLHNGQNYFCNDWTNLKWPKSPFTFRLTWICLDKKNY